MRVLFHCGAGVSLPSGMPSFIGLAQHVIDYFDPPEDSDAMRPFQPWIDDPTGSNMPLDQVFNLLHQEYGKDAVNALVTDRHHSLCAGHVQPLTILVASSISISTGVSSLGNSR